MKPKALVLQAHGSNRDFDVMEALTSLAQMQLRFRSTNCG